MKNTITEMPFLMHLEELRKRFFRIAWVFTILFSICAYYSKELFSFLQKPLQKSLPTGSFFIATTAISGWLVYLRVAMLISVILIVPFLIFEFWNFVSPGLEKHERKFLWPITLMMTLFFFGGILFAFKLVLPWGLAFLATVYQDTSIRFLPQIDDYLGFVMTTLLGFGVLFELPFLVLFLIQAHLVKIETFKKFRPYFYVLAFVVGAILTPPDVVSQVMMSVPFILLFELGLVFSKIFNIGKPSPEL